MSIQKALKDLYDNWEKDHPDEQLIRHGLIHEETYMKSKPRIVLLGKEPNERSHGFQIMDFLRKELRKGKKGDSFCRPAKQAGLWAYGILYGFRRYPDENKCAAKGLKSIGWTNLKKSGGKGTAKGSELLIRQAALNQLDLWKKEIEIMDPDVIIFSGTYQIAAPLLNLYKIPIPDTKGRYCSNYKLNRRSCYCLDFYHHATRRPYKETYQLLEDVWRKGHDARFRDFLETIYYDEPVNWRDFDFEEDEDD